MDMQQFKQLAGQADEWVKENLSDMEMDEITLMEVEFAKIMMQKHPSDPYFTQISILSGKGSNGKRKMIRTAFEMNQDMWNQRFEVLFKAGIRVALETEDNFEGLAFVLSTEAWMKAVNRDDSSGVSSKIMAGEIRIADLPDKESIVLVTTKSLDGRISAARFSILENTEEKVAFGEVDESHLLLTPERLSGSSNGLVEAKLLDQFIAGYCKGIVIKMLRDL